MTITQAVNRIVFRMKQHRTNQLDQEALDCLVDYINIQDEAAYMENLLFAKLFVERFMFLSATGKYTASDVLSIISETLSMPMYQIVEQMSSEVPFYKFEHTLSKFKRPTDPFNLDAIRKENHRLSKEHKTELTKALRTKYTIEQATAFLKNQVGILSNKFNRKEYA